MIIDLSRRTANILYVLIVGVIAILSLLAYRTIPAKVGIPLTLTNWQIGLGLALIIAAAFIGIAAAYHDSVDEIGPVILVLSGFLGAACSFTYSHYYVGSVIGAVTVAAFLSYLLAGFIEEQVF